MDRNYINEHRDGINNYIKSMEKKHKNKIECTRTNFIFLIDGSMIYPYDFFKDYFDAIADAVIQGENIDDIVSLVFREKIDQPIIKNHIVKLINECNINS